MELIGITPIANKDLMLMQPMVMCLTHLVERHKDYEEAFKNYTGYKILDNSLIELQGALSMDRLVDAAQKIKANEIILEDAFLDGEKTVELAKKAIQWLKDNNLLGTYKLQAVAHGKNKKEWEECFNALDAMEEIDVIGIPKVCSTWLESRNRGELSSIFMKSKKQLHFLGAYYNLDELLNLNPKVFYRVRSCDTCLPALCVIQNKGLSDDRSGTIDLEYNYPELNWDKYAKIFAQFYKKVEENYHYDLTFIGAGPSSIFAILNLLGHNYQGKICLIEKGKSLKERQPNEVLNGFCGAGTFSDSKLSSALDVGGDIPDLTQEQLSNYETKIINILNNFKHQTNNKELLVWDNTESYDVKDSSLIWNIHKTCHIGTENGQAIYKKIEEFISQFPNVDIYFETEVDEVNPFCNNFRIDTNNYNPIYTSKVIIATGQKNMLPAKIMDDFGLESKPRAFQIGVRVVDEINPIYENIIKANYDFKFTKSYNYGDVKVKVRTFCCNSGNAHTCAEKASEGFICFNGHAFKDLDPNNTTVNYGIMCEVEGIDKFNSKQNQIQLMKNINNIDSWLEDNFDIENKKPLPKRKLLSGLEVLRGYYPDEVISSMSDFISELNKVVDLSKAYYLYPEVKLSGFIPNLNYKTFETEYKNLYMIGDCAISRGIMKASITGLMFSESILNKEYLC